MADLDVFALPSYESARLPDAWPYIISQLSRRDLVHLSLVSRKFRNIAQGSLWSEPRKQWDQEDSNTMDDLHRFMDALTISHRSSTKPHLYVQALDLSNLGSDSLTYTFTNGWASRLLSQLPNLSAFAVSHTDAFDHGCIDAGMRPCERLRLLSVMSCPNLTPKTLLKLLKSAPNLYYLEVSDCVRTRDSQVLEEISQLSKLGILKLARSGYKDDDIVSFARSVIALRADQNNPLPQNIRSLDIRDNDLTDNIIDSIKFLGEALPAADEPPPYDADNLGDVESSPLISSPESGWSSFFEARTPHLDDHDIFSDQRMNVTREVRSPGFRSPVEAGDLGNGITHLYLSGNALSTSAVVAFLRTLPLENLDYGVASSIGGAERSNETAIPADISAARDILDAVADCTTLNTLKADHKLVTGFISCQSQEPETNDTQDLPPYPYAWLRHQGTQWDPMVLQGLPVKMLQFSPALLVLESLTLTSIPQKADKEFVKCMQAFLNAAGDMQGMVQQYQIRKGYRSRRATKLSGALGKILLEINSPEQPQDQYDQDTETFGDALRDDFSFFPDEKEANSNTSKLQTMSIQDGSDSTELPSLTDIVVELSNFRRQQRDMSSTNGKSNKRTISSWKGRLTIVRKAST